MYTLFIFTQAGTVLKFEYASIKRAFDHGRDHSSAVKRKIVRGQYSHTF